MSAPARLLSVRLQGFKSFAERTTVTFGPGISAVVGPNGSGKSNLADALRWALGEQGRALRSRRSEDVIWAGSERRAAVGMADVQLTLDNGDGLLAVEFGAVELGRRLFRSGENEYQLNRQRIRLRDLVDLLDGAHLAENAFLFIGQGMVDQALALRPEERRPLFEEVAGVRRHDRRRRRAAEQLAESEVNLARVEDILAELRPQARRLAALAEQQATRRSAGDELVAALLDSAHARWHAAATAIDRAARELDGARGQVAAAVLAVEVAEGAAAATAAALASRAATARGIRDRADVARAALTEAQLRDGRLAAETAALGRDRARRLDERATAEADLARHRRQLAEPPPVIDHGLQAALGAAERELAEALAELAATQAAAGAEAADRAAIQRVAAARAAEAESARRRAAEASAQATTEAARAAEQDVIVERLGADHAAARAALDAAMAAASTATLARAAAEEALEARRAEARSASEAAAVARSALAELEARRAGAAARLSDDTGSSIAALLRARGGRRLDEDLEVEPELRAAVAAALGAAAGAYVATRRSLLELGGERGVAVIADLESSASTPHPGSGQTPTGGASGDSIHAAIRAAGGGLLAPAVRRDGTGLARRLLGRAAWAPDLATAIDLAAALPAGWIVACRDGSATIAGSIARLGEADHRLEHRAELASLLGQVDAARTAAADGGALEAAATEALAAARAALDAARADERRADEARRALEDRERSAATRLEAGVREAAWLRAQAERLADAAERARSAVPPAPVPGPAAAARGAVSADPATGIVAAVATWTRRADELRQRRDRLAAEVAAMEAGRRDAERRRAAVDASMALAESRLADADAAIARIDEQVAGLAEEAAATQTALAEARVADAAARAELDRLGDADATDRASLAAAEGKAVAAREQVRAAEDRARVAEHHELEARLGLEALREQLLVDLAAIGGLGLARLAELGAARDPRPATGPGPARAPGAARDPGAVLVAATPPDPDRDLDDDAGTPEAFQAALEAAGRRWASTEPPAEVPGPSRLAVLRRRFHALGAANPDALDEYAAVKGRLDELESQHDDLRTAISRTRALIEDLETMIASQFRTTFRALETTFDARFRQLFGGGFARLSLTEPDDLATTGIEIVARPPGKKPQALAMLSGGERALTAVALLFAMLEVRPVPFCVLDEVDAALDEANVGRFTAALRDLAAQTQFIVITHNRGTIETADALYGVTVGDDSVSRVISLRLDEATELAARRRDPVAVGPSADADPAVTGS